ncbi:MAG: hypothetical protein ACREH6_01700, partial [Geminicoccaceae bacterium]
MAGGLDAKAQDRMLAWLDTQGRRIAEPTWFLEALGEQLGRAGIGVDRLTTGVPIIHPQIDSSSALWRRGEPAAERLFALDAGGFERLASSPIFGVYQGGPAVRARLEGPPPVPDYPIYADLRTEGMSDYLVLPAPFSDGTTKAMTFATRRRGGFTDAELRLLEALMPTLALILEVEALRRTALTLM